VAQYLLIAIVVTLILCGGIHRSDVLFGRMLPVQ
jgi:hypothetical protein